MHLPSSVKDQSMYIVTCTLMQVCSIIEGDEGTVQEPSQLQIVHQLSPKVTTVSTWLDMHIN